MDPVSLVHPQLRGVAVGCRVSRMLNLAEFSSPGAKQAVFVCILYPLRVSR